jgi:hypothetical protein
MQWSPFRLHIILFLGVYAKLRKATISFVMSDRPHGTRLQLDVFSENLIFECFFFLRKSVEKIEVSLDSDKNKGTLHDNQYTYLISRSVLPRMWNVSDKSCSEYQNAHFIFSNFFFSKIVQFMRQCGKNIVQPDGPQMTIWRRRIACWIPTATNAHSEFVIRIAFPTQQWLHKPPQCYGIRTLFVLFPVPPSISTALISCCGINMVPIMV